MNMRLIFARVVAVLLALAGFQSVADAQNDNWIKTTGNWSLGSNWSTGSPPTSSQNAVITNSGAAVSEDINATIQNLTIGSGDSLGINNNIVLTIKGTSISNSGSFSINSGGNGTELLIGNANTTLSGTGTLTMDNLTTNIIEGTANGNKLTNQSTIQGAGNIGNGVLTLVNSGTINGNVSNALTIQTNGGTTNTGTLEATNGGTLFLTGSRGGGITNTSGTIEAVGSSSFVQLDGGVGITGGTLTSTSGGLIEDISVATLSGLTISSGSTVQMNDGTTLNLVGTITNNGTLSMQGANSQTFLKMNGNVTLTGTGSVTMRNNTPNIIEATTSGNTLTNQETIQGSGNIGNGVLTLVNKGTIDANNGVASNPLTIQTNGGTTNTGTLEATNGGTLFLTGNRGGGITNTSGTIKAVGTSSMVQLDGGVTITGGTLTSASGGLIEDISVATLSRLTISSGSTVQMKDGTTLNLVGTITNNGTLSMQGANVQTPLVINGNVTLTGTGSLTLSIASNNLIEGSTNSNTLTNRETIQGAGNIGNGVMTLVNAGTIDALPGNPQLIIQTSGGTTNTGTLEANGGTLFLTGNRGGGITNTGGTIKAVGTFGTVQLDGGVGITGGTLTSGSGGLIEDISVATVSGLTISTGSTVQMNDGATLNLVGTITNNGTLSMQGANVQTPLVINGNVTLNGTKGVLLMANSAVNNVIEGNPTTSILTNNSTIEGSGTIGNNQMGLVNGKTGAISATGSNPLIIEPDSKNFNNLGTLSAVNGSVLQINTSGGSFLNFNGGTSTLTGGTYIANNGTIEFPAGSNGIVTDAANITLSGASAEILNTTNNTNALTKLNTIASAGSFTINSGANFTTAGNFTNNGTLTVGSGSSFVVNLASNLTNFNATSHTLTGGTYVDSGTLQFKGANIQTIAANTSVTMSGASAKIEDQTGAANGLSHLATNNGTFGIGSGINFTTLGNFTDTGTLNIGAGTKFTVNLADNLTNFNSSTHTLTSGTYNVTGTLEFNNANIITNSANLMLSGTSSQIINQSSANALANFATNNDSFVLAGKRSFTTAGNFTDAGSLTINTGSTFTIGGPGIFTQSGGMTTNNGLLSASGGIKLNGGSLFGTGSIAGALKSSSAAAVSPGASSTTAGILKETGAYTQNSGILDININGKTAGTQYDQFNPTTAALSGTLNITRLSSFIPAIGSTFKIMNFSSKTGTFSTVNGTAINSTEHFAVTYQPTDVLLTVVAGATSPTQPAYNFLPLPVGEVERGVSGETLLSNKGSARSTVVVALNTGSRVPDNGSSFALFVIALLSCALFHSTSRRFVSSLS
jgi:hypothetical protein